MQDLIDQAVEELRRKQFLDAVNAGYQKLRSKPAAWKRELRERGAWDATLLDGLGD